MNEHFIFKCINPESVIHLIQVKQFQYFKLLLHVSFVLIISTILL